MDPRADERGRQVRPRLLAALGALATTGTLAAPAGTPAGTKPGSRNAGLTGNLLVLLDVSRPRDGALPAGATAAAATAAAAAAAGAVPAGHSVPQIGLLTVRPRPGTAIAALAARLRSLPGVASVEPEHRYVPRSLPDDPALSQIDPSEGLPYQWYLSAEGFPAAWSYARGERALLGVIDTGIDATHPELASKIAAAVDQQDPSDARGTARTDEVGHGTHVASLACADTDNRRGIAGAGYDCRLVVEKSDFSDSSVAAAIVDATDRGVLALNMSFGPSSQTDVARSAPASEVRALEYAARHRVVLVAAASDSPGTEQGDPANVLQPAGTGPHLAQGIGLDVTAADHSGLRAPFAGSGSEVSLAAYGALQSSSETGPMGVSCHGTPSGLFGAYPANTTDLESFPPAACRITFAGDDRYAYLAGTSMAAPQVAAAGALMRALNPFATLADILRTIKLTARRTSGAGWGSDLGWGILDAGAAVMSIRRDDRLPPVSVLSAPRTTQDTQVLLRWSGHDGRWPGLIVSGIAYYLVYVSAGGHARLLRRTSGHSLSFTGQPGVRYTFSLYAVDRAGNRQLRPARASTLVQPL